MPVHDHHNFADYIFKGITTQGNFLVVLISQKIVPERTINDICSDTNNDTNNDNNDNSTINDDIVHWRIYASLGLGLFEHQGGSDAVDRGFLKKHFVTCKHPDFTRIHMGYSALG